MAAASRAGVAAFVNCGPWWQLTQRPLPLNTFIPVIASGVIAAGLLTAVDG